jgi:23S rRNA (pseudouridine1915-N3)-methyltransferase
VHVRLVAVGDKQPAWVNHAFDDYTGRLPRHWQFRVDTVAAAPRSRSRNASAAVEAEGQEVLGRVARPERLVLLDERGRQASSRDFSDWLDAWQQDGRDLCFLIGGPDGVSQSVVERADLSLSLSPMTLPHGLARVLFAEQLYRAWTLLQGHPYHRD